jgi:hypothetical protein
MSKFLLALLALSCLSINVVYMQQTCVDQNTSLCALFGSQYCDGTSYLNGMLYSTYCAKLCNNCNCKRILSLTPITPPPFEIYFKNRISLQACNPCASNPCAYTTDARKCTQASTNVPCGGYCTFNTYQSCTTYTCLPFVYPSR